VAVLAAVIEQTALGAANDARLLHAPLAAGTAQALGMEVTRDPPATLRLVQQVGNGKNHTEILSYAQILDMSHVLYRLVKGGRGTRASLLLQPQWMAGSHQQHLIGCARNFLIDPA
jgi:hypothetical protein